MRASFLWIMGLTLPSDVRFIIFDVLRDERDYNSIYQCAISSKYLAEQALATLYRWALWSGFYVATNWDSWARLYDTSPVSGGGIEDEQFRTIGRRTGTTTDSARNDRHEVLRKWALMWRSIILSTFDLTYLPYYSYIRYLDLNDLLNLLRDLSGSKIRKWGLPTLLFRYSLGLTGAHNRL